MRAKLRHRAFTRATRRLRATRRSASNAACCRRRIRSPGLVRATASELDARPSKLSPVWYAGAFAIGAASGVLGDEWSLGFIAETERQVCEHLTSHLTDCRTRMRAAVRSSGKCATRKKRHGENAGDAGAAELPDPIRELMRADSPKS